MSALSAGEHAVVQVADPMIRNGEVRDIPEFEGDRHASEDSFLIVASRTV